MNHQALLTAHRAFLPLPREQDNTNLWRKKFIQLNALNRPATNLTEQTK